MANKIIGIALIVVGVALTGWAIYVIADASVNDPFNIYRKLLWIVPGICAAVAGFILHSLGSASTRMKDRIERAALDMHKSTGKVDPEALAVKLGYEEMTVRRIVGLAQRDGLIPK